MRGPTSPKAWSSWRSGLIRGPRPRRTPGRAQPAARALPPVGHRRGRGARGRAPPAASSISVEPVADGSRVTVDRPGPGRAARRRRRDVRAAAHRRCGPPGPGRRTSTASRSGRSPRSTSTPAVLRQRYDAIAGGPPRPGGRGCAGRRRGRCRRRSSSAPRPRRRPPCWRCGPRTGPGVVYLVCAALARLDVAVRSAHVDTLGPQAVDVFYLQEAAAGGRSATSGRRRPPTPCGRRWRAGHLTGQA